MRIENTYLIISTHPKESNYKKKNFSHNNIVTKTDNINFGSKIDKPAGSIIGKIADIILSPITKIIKKNKLKAQLKREAEEAERIAQQKAWKAAKELKDQKRLIAAKELLEDWRSKNKGKFESKITEDTTGEIEHCKDDVKTPISDYSGKTDYTLVNFAASGYASRPSLGQTNWFLKHNDIYITPQMHYNTLGDYHDFLECKWKMKYIEGLSANSKYSTVLTCGFYDRGAYAMSRIPGLHITADGIISKKDMEIIKKNIVEKGLWQNFIQKQDDDSIIGLFNEFINHLNK